MIINRYARVGRVKRLASSLNFNTILLFLSRSCKSFSCRHNKIYLSPTLIQFSVFTILKVLFITVQLIFYT